MIMQGDVDELSEEMDNIKVYVIATLVLQMTKNLSDHEKRNLANFIKSPIFVAKASMVNEIGLDYRKMYNLNLKSEDVLFLFNYYNKTCALPGGFKTYYR